MLGPLTPREAELAGTFDRGGALRLEVLDPSRLADERWYDNSIFNGLARELSAWANIFCSDVLAVGQTRWHVYSPMVYRYLTGPLDEWPASLAKRLEGRMARCQKVAFFCHTTAHWTLAVADPGSRLVRVFDSYPGRSAGQEVGLALASFFSEHLPTSLSSVEERRVWRYSVMECELQSNDYDCGPHSILNLLRAVAFHRDGRWYSGPGISAIRRRVAAMLLSPVKGSSWCASHPITNVEP